jgi:hypothetical protein
MEVRDYKEVAPKIGRKKWSVRSNGSASRKQRLAAGRRRKERGNEGTQKAEKGANRSNESMRRDWVGVNIGHAQIVERKGSAWRLSASGLGRPFGRPKCASNSYLGAS